jgi:hypothetical protein
MWGLVDSGATESLFPQRMAKPLGINIRRCGWRACQTAGGQTRQRIWRPGLDVEIPDMEDMRVTLSASFSKDLPAKLMLLGRRDFFRHFRVVIDESVPSFTLIRLPTV